MKSSNAFGQTVGRGSVFGKERIDISNFPPGNYFLRLESGVMKSFVVQK